MARARIYEVSGDAFVTPEGDVYPRHVRNGRGYSRGRRNEQGAAVELVDTYDRARVIREAFYGRAMERATPTDIRWPPFVRYVGITNSEQYLSDKKLADWKKQLFKHLAEDEQYLLINPTITTLVNDRGDAVEFREPAGRMRGPEGGRVPTAFYASSWALRGLMPRHFSVLAEDRGVQWVTSDRQFWEMRLPKKCTLAAAPFVYEDGTIADDKAFLFSYSDEGVHYLITGQTLNVTKDGIVN